MADGDCDEVDGAVVGSDVISIDVLISTITEDELVDVVTDIEEVLVVGAAVLELVYNVLVGRVLEVVKDELYKLDSVEDVNVLEVSILELC